MTYSDQLNMAYRLSDAILEANFSYSITVLDFLSFFRANPADIFTFVTAQTESSLAKSNTNDEMTIELNDEFLMKLQSNAYYGMFDEDVVDHIAKVLKMLDLIKIPNVDSHRLCTKGFPLSLADDARQW
ncbi:hypothetical protein Tco_1558153 [Tanacetum coccineum]